MKNKKLKIDYSKVRAEAEKQANELRYRHGVGDKFKLGFKDGFEKGVIYAENKIIANRVAR